MLVGSTIPSPMFLASLDSVFEFRGPADSLAQAQRANDAFDHAVLVGRDRFQAHTEALLGRTTIARIGNGMDPPPSVVALFDSLLAQGQEAQASGRYRDAFYAYEKAMALPDPRRPIVQYLYASAIFRDGRAPRQAEYVLTLARELEEELAGRTLSPLEKALQAFVDRLLCEALGVLERIEESAEFHRRGVERLKALCAPRELTEGLEFFGAMVAGVTVSRIDPTTKKILPPQPAASEKDAGGQALMDMLLLAMKAGVWSGSLCEDTGHWSAFLIAESALRAHFDRSQNHRAIAKLDFEAGLHNHALAGFSTALKGYREALESLKKAGDEVPPAAGGGYEPANWSPMIRLLADLCAAALDQTVFYAPTEETVYAEIARIRDTPRHGFPLTLAGDMAIHLGLRLVHRKSFLDARDALDLGAELMLAAVGQQAGGKNASHRGRLTPDQLAKDLLAAGKGKDLLLYQLHRQCITNYGYGLIHRQAASEDSARAEELLKRAEQSFHRALFFQIKLKHLEALQTNPSYRLLEGVCLTYGESVMWKKVDLGIARRSKKEALDLLRRSFPETAGFEKRPDVAAILSELESLENPAPSPAMN